MSHVALLRDFVDYGTIEREKVFATRQAVSPFKEGR